MPLKRYAIIPARGSSKGIPRKNLYFVAGKPLLYYTIKAALDAKVFDEVTVSSESDEILSYASEMGVISSKRPEHLSRDNVHSIYVVLDYIKSQRLLGDATVCMLLPTSPLRSSGDIRQALEKYENSNADSLVSVYRDNKHILNFRRVNHSGYLEPVIKANPNVQRQEIDPLYVVNGSIYVSRPKILLKYKSFHMGKVIPFVMDKRLSIDINTLEDIREVEMKIKKCE